MKLTVSPSTPITSVLSLSKEKKSIPTPQPTPVI